MSLSQVSVAAWDASTTLTRHVHLTCELCAFPAPCSYALQQHPLPPALPPHRKMAITELPQMVAAYHSLVGLAATVTSIATVMMANEAGHDPDTVHNVTAFLGTLIGAVTLTGSGIAFGKLHGVLSSAPLALPGKNVINVGLLAGGHQGACHHVTTCWRWLLYLMAMEAALAGQCCTACSACTSPANFGMTLCPS